MTRSPTVLKDERCAAVWLLATGGALTAFLGAAPVFGGWGLEHYRAAPLVVRLALAAGAAISAWILWRRRGAAAGVFRLLSRPTSPFLLLPVVWGMCIVLRERRYIGDWINLAFTVPLQPDWILSPGVLWRAPLTNLLEYLHWTVLVRPATGSQTLFGWQVLFAAYGAGLLGVQWAIGRAAFGSRRSAGLHILLYATSGLLFFSLGHVENYVVSMTVMATAVWASVRAIRRRRGAGLACLLFGAAAMAHPQAIVYSPAMLVVVFAVLPERRRVRYAVGCVAGVLAVPVLLAGIATAMGWGIDPQAMVGGQPSGTLLPPRMAFAQERVLELLMILARMFPVLPAVLIAALVWRKRLPASDPVGLWFALAAGPAACYCLFIWNKKPMRVDWDLLGLSLMMLWMAGIYALLRTAPVRRRIQVALCVAVLQLPHAALWIAWNTVPDPAQRPEIETLQRTLEGQRKEGDRHGIRKGFMG